MKLKPLVIFELANNHMGDLNHAKKIIKQYYELSKVYRDKIKFALKFQYRDPETFINESFKNSNDNHVVRFKSTFFSRKKWNEIIKFSKNKFTLICTPFDEISVDNVIKDKFEFLKIASCSSTDWPLLEKIAKKNIKIICSLGGLTDDEISKVISFFTGKKKKVSFLYCVARYPTESKDLNLDYFSKLKKKYGNKIAGISLHEEPNQYMSGAIGYGMGSRIFEKHIGLETSKYSLNKYSTSDKNMRKWLDHLIISIDQFGDERERNKYLNLEKKQLGNFKRGVYLKENKTKNKGEVLKESDVKFQFPAQISSKQLTANDFSRFVNFKVKRKINSGSPIFKKDLLLKDNRSKVELIREKILDISSKANLIIPKFSKIEISHHYGLENFEKYGLAMITILNLVYCKKYLFLLNNQIHPSQYHKKKQETFLIVYGKCKLDIVYKRKKSSFILKPGETFTIKVGMIHKFKCISDSGCVIEEISTTSIKSDSFYIDSKISKNKNRKSFISFY